MARTQKAKKEDNAINFKLELEKGVFLDVGLDSKVDDWMRDIRDQLVVWRNIPIAEQINQYNESVKKICRRYDVDNRKPKGTKDKQILSNVIGFVRRSTIEANNQLGMALATLKFLKSAFVLDEINKQFRFRSDVANLFSEAEIETAIEDYFLNQPVEHGPAFPTYQSDVAAEYLFPLMALLVTNFNIDMQIEDAVKAHDIEQDDKAEEEEKLIDDAGFLASGLDTVLED